MIKKLIDELHKKSQEFQNLSISEKKSYTYLNLNCLITSPISLIPPAGENSFFLSKPDSGNTMVGIGALVSFSSIGKNRFNSIKKQYTTFIKKCYQEDKSKSIQAFMAFAFNEDDAMQGKWASFPNSTLIIPELLIKEFILQGHKAQILDININIDGSLTIDKSINSIINQLTDYIEQSKNSTLKKIKAKKNYLIKDVSNKEKYKKRWKQLSLKAINKIKQGNFEKLVTSRCCSHVLDQAISIPQLIENLKTYYPSCTIISYQTASSTIVAASPERLLNLHYPLVESDAIGGTLQNSQHISQHSSHHSSSLFTGQLHSYMSKKLLKEHHFISHDIYHRLDPFCHTLKMPVSPILMKLHNMYHLETLIQGVVKPHFTIFDMLEALHPTPAVSGFPAAKAKKWLIENENYNRGWYSGAFGWVDSHFDGELSVMLRCALINNNKIDMFAGAGLVAESDPENEWQEIETKMGTIIDRL